MTYGLTYRPEIDGLRAVAVLPVIAFHAGFFALPGGFAGVDVFFVISGYLITTILLAERAAGRLSILTFYERRARRILPALFVVSLACLPFAWAWMLPEALESFFDSLAAVMLFLSNIHFLDKAGGYFGPDLELQPLLHTWSLAVEEQYYLLLPLILILARSRRGLWAVLLGLTASSLALAIWGEANRPEKNFFFTFSRLWELLAGSLLALALDGRRLPRRGGWLALLGLGLIVAAMLLHGPGSGYPGLAAVMPVAGACLVILGAGPGTLAGRILAWRPLVGIGLISYSAYLWHQPLFAFARIRTLDAPPDWLMAGLAGLSLALAWLTWRWVEQPFRRPQNRLMPGRGLLFAASLTGLTTLAGIGFWGAAQGGFPGRTADLSVAQRVAALAERNTRLMDLCHFGDDQAMPPGLAIAACNTGGDAPLDAILIGDSHASALRVALFEAAKGVNIGTVAYGACPPVPGLVSDRESGCHERNEALFAGIEASPVPVVILVARWSLYTSGHGFDNGEGGRESKFLSFHDPDHDGDRAEGVHYAYARAVARLQAAGKQVVLVYPVPEAGWHVTDRLVQGVRFGYWREDVSFGTDPARFSERHAAVIAGFDALSGRGLIRLRPDLILCDTSLPGRCSNVVNGVPLYDDDDHLSLAGAELVVAKLIDAVRAAQKRTKVALDADQ